jgi:hypothetical protein
MGKADEDLYSIPVADMEMPMASSLVPGNMAEIRTELDGYILLNHDLANLSGQPYRKHLVIPDGNRGAIIPNIEIPLWDRQFIIGIKGIGARMAMYKDDKDEITGIPLTFEPRFSSESWFGENPWGAMSHKGCLEDLMITELAGKNGINGFYICPMLRATPLPTWLMKEANKQFWYRKLESDKPFYQQLRLMPSDVRLFYQSEATLGKRTLAVLNAFKITTLEDLDMFVDNYIASGIAALTLYARTLKHFEELEDADSGFLGLDFTDVWLDKDSVIAPDGTIFFADIEGIEWKPSRNENELKIMMSRQFDRNFYEFMYGVDCLLRERDKMQKKASELAILRESFAARLELAIQNDQYLKLERSRNALNLILLPKQPKNFEFQIKIIDFDGDDV